MKKLVSKYKGYTFYEYLESNIPLKEVGYGIETNIKLNLETYDFEAAIQSNRLGCKAMPFASNGTYHTWVYYYGGDTKLHLYATKDDGTQIGSVGTDEDLNKHTVTFKNKQFFIDDELKGNWTNNTFREDTNNMWFFTWDKLGGYTYSGKIFYAKFWNNGILVNHFLPASNSEGVFGLYDLVNDVFYTNKGTGAFSVGEQINIEVDVEEVKCRWITKNLANLKDWVSGYLDSNGMFYKPDFNNLTSNYIDCKPNTKYYYYHSVYGNTTYLWSAVCYYNQDKSFIKREYACDNSAGKQSGFFTTPANCYYIRVGSRWLEPQFNPKVLLAESSVATKYVPYIQTAKEIKTIAPQLTPTIYSSNKTVTGVTGTFDGDNLDFKGTNNAADSNISFSSYYRVPILKFGKYIFETTCIKRNEKGACQFYIYGKKNGSNYYYIAGANHTVGITKRVIIDLKEDMLQNNATSFYVYPQIVGTKGDIVDCAYTFRVIPIVSAKEIKTKVNGEIKTINLDYELAEDVEPSLLSLDEEDNNNSDTDAPDTI